MSNLSIFELFSMVGIFHLSSIIYSRKLPQKPIFEFIICIIPQYLAVVFIEHLWKLYLVFFMALLIPNRNQPTTFSVGDTIDKLRFIIISLVAVAVFAADFSFYHVQRAKLGKSMGDGLKLMDIGVGSFVYNSGFFSLRTTRKKKFKGIFLAFFLGTVRLISKHVFELDINEAEFGKHLNFFYILGILNIMSLFVHSKYDFYFGFFLCIFHEVSLYLFGVKELIYNTLRQNIFAANIEGIMFIAPELGMFLMASGISSAYKAKRNSVCISYLLLGFFTMILSSIYSVSNRRIHNLLYCMIIFTLHTFNGIMIEILGSSVSKGSFHLIHFSSRHLLLLLILSNILTLLNKLTTMRLSSNDISGHLICLLYMFKLFYLPSCFMKTKQHAKILTETKFE